MKPYFINIMLNNGKNYKEIRGMNEYYSTSYPQSENYKRKVK